ncbi:hypothetical protein [Flavobacterium laiguense]|nr:hypothetical protein [Flavobacterium laiguense]
MGFLDSTIAQGFNLGLRIVGFNCLLSILSPTVETVGYGLMKKYGPSVF